MSAPKETPMGQGHNLTILLGVAANPSLLMF